MFLTCTPIELARLPWETWEILTDLGTGGNLRIVRSPANIVYESVPHLRRRARILVILGDDTNLNFQAETEALKSLQGIEEIKLIGNKIDVDIKFGKLFYLKTEIKNLINQLLKHQKSSNNTVNSSSDAKLLKTKIIQAIADESGWDILFFLGHSNENVLTGGELGIAPNVSLSIKEIEESLKQAKQRGLQFAIFNSCSGINIAESLINLGLSQVAVMREPIHNQVAQVFLRQFLKSLADYKDVHEALLDACQFLQQENNRLSYPSAYLIPSLFRHPEAELFRLHPIGLTSKVKRWLPNGKEAVWLLGFLALSLLPPVQDLLLEPRLLLQSVYRQITFQIPSQVEFPVLLVKIDNQSLLADKVKPQYPIDDSYLAKLIKTLANSDVKLIGIDYYLDKTHLDDPKQKPTATLELKQSIRDAVNEGTWFVFGFYTEQNTKQGKVSPEIASLNWSLEGDTNFFPWYVELLPINQNCLENCPFGYLLALAYSLQNEPLNKVNLPQPNLQSNQNFLASILQPQNIQKEQTVFLERLRLHPISKFLGWFHPIIDFSIPPDEAYQSLAACELLKSCESKQKEQVPNYLNNKVAIIVPGGYKEAGIKGDGEDNYTLPLAVKFWRGWGDGIFSGGEAHAYMVHHFLTRHLVVPVPDFLMVLLAALLGKGITLILLNHPRQRQLILIRLGSATVVYIIVSCQTYISAVVLLPWFLPAVVLWNYIRLALRRKSYG